MATNADIRAGLADRLRTIADLRVYERPPGEIVVDAAVVRRRTISYGVTLDTAGAVWDVVWGITVFVAFSNTDAATEALDEYLAPSGARSILAAVNADPTLGGVVDAATVVSAEGESVTAYAGVDYLTVEFVIEVIV